LLAGALVLATTGPGTLRLTRLTPTSLVPGASTLWSFITRTPFGFFQFRFTLGRNRAQRDAFTFVIDTGDPGRDDIANLDCLMQVLDVRIGHTADVDQPAAIGRQFDKDTKRHHADDNTDD
jgi:hypothetical protein